MSSDSDITTFLERMAEESAIPPMDPVPVVRRSRRRLARNAVVGTIGAALAVAVTLGSVSFLRSSPNQPADPTPLPPILREGELLTVARNGWILALDPGTGEERRIVLPGVRFPDRGLQHLPLPTRAVGGRTVARLRPVDVHRLLPLRPAGGPLGRERARRPAPPELPVRSTGELPRRGLGLVAAGGNARGLWRRRRRRSGHHRPAHGSTDLDRGTGRPHLRARVVTRRGASRVHDQRCPRHRARDRPNDDPPRHRGLRVQHGLVPRRDSDHGR